MSEGLHPLRRRQVVAHPDATIAKGGVAIGPAVLHRVKAHGEAGALAHRRETLEERRRRITAKRVTGHRRQLATVGVGDIEDVDDAERCRSRGDDRDIVGLLVTHLQASNHRGEDGDAT